MSVATHDPALAAESLRRLEAAGTPFELELVLGLPVRRALLAPLASGTPARAYVPFGRSHLPYDRRRVLRQPRVAWWAAQDVVLGPRKATVGLRRVEGRRRPAPTGGSF